jgi:hypothetical protein
MLYRRKIIELVELEISQILHLDKLPNNEKFSINWITVELIFDGFFTT